MNIGDISEAKALADLSENFEEVLTPFSDNSAYDFVVEENEKLKKVQVKHAKIENGSVRCKSLRKTNMTSAGAKQTTYNENEVDYFLFYCSQNETSYLVPFEETPATEISLRLDEKNSKHANNIRWAEQYTI